MRQEQINFKTHSTCTISGDQAPYRPLLCQSPNKRVSCSLTLPSSALRVHAASASCSQPRKGWSTRTARALPSRVCSAGATPLQPFFHPGNPSSTGGGSPWHPENNLGSLPDISSPTGGLSPCSILPYQWLLPQSWTWKPHIGISGLYIDHHHISKPNHSHMGQVAELVRTHFQTYSKASRGGTFSPNTLPGQAQSLDLPEEQTGSTDCVIHTC